LYLYAAQNEVTPPNRAPRFFSPLLPRQNHRVPTTPTRAYTLPPPRIRPPTKHPLTRSADLERMLLTHGASHVPSHVTLHVVRNARGQRRCYALRSAQTPHMLSAAAHWSRYAVALQREKKHAKYMKTRTFMENDHTWIV
jgi:hypothetical protein